MQPTLRRFDLYRLGFGLHFHSLCGLQRINTAPELVNLFSLPVPPLGPAVSLAASQPRPPLGVRPLVLQDPAVHLYLSNILLPILLLYATKRIKISWTFTDVYHMKNIWNKSMVVTDNQELL